MPKSVLAVLAVLVLAGAIGIAMAVLVGFEEPPTLLYTLSALCILAPPIALLVHFWLTKALSREEKQFWLKGLFSRKALQVASAYLAKLQGSSAGSSA